MVNAQRLASAIFFALPSVTLAATTAQTVINAVNKIDTDLKTLNSSVTAFTGGNAQSVQALQIQSEEGNVQTDLNNAIKVVQGAPDFDDTDSSNIASAFLNLVGDTESTLQNIINKKPAFEKPIFGFVTPATLVLGDLKQLNTSSNTLGNDIEQKLDSTYASVAPIIIAQVAAAFDKAIAAYSSSSPF